MFQVGVGGFLTLAFNGTRVGAGRLINEKLYTMEEQKLRQLFKNRSNCYVDTDDVVQGMDEDCFVETVNEALRLHDVSRRSELLFAFIAEIKSEFADQNWDYLDFIAERVIGKQ